MEDDFVKQFKEEFNKLPTYVLELGVIENKTNRDNNKGVTNAELMFIHENGSPINHIPSRPVLEMTIEYAEKELMDKTIDKIIKKYAESGFDKNLVEQEISRLGMRMESYARKIIYSNDGRLAPNAPSTIKKKGDNHPLLDTGQLARSITCQIVNE